MPPSPGVVWDITACAGDAAALLAFPRAGRRSGLF